jgi:hypothetical protein
VAPPSSGGAARRLVRQALAETGFAGLVEARELVVYEAVTTAVVHTGTTIDVTLMFIGAGAASSVPTQQAWPRAARLRDRGHRPRPLPGTPDLAAGSHRYVGNRLRRHELVLVGARQDG